MKYQIIGKNILVTDAIRSSAEKKLAKLEKYFSKNEELTCKCVLKTYNVGTKVEVTITTPYMDFRAEVKNEDLYNAFDDAVTKLESQMRKLKDRMLRKNREGLTDSIIYENILDEENSEKNDTIVRMKTMFLKPMSIEDAITKMEAIGHDFFVYLDSDEEKVNVVYKRKDGGYGTIQIENAVK